MCSFRCLMSLLLVAIAGASLAGDGPGPEGPATAEEPPLQGEQSSAGDALSACLASCDAIEAECSGAVRSATPQCMRLAATGGLDPLSMRRDFGTWYCGYFNEPRCGGARDRAGCALRYTALYTLCGDYYTDNVAGRYFDCKAGEANSLTLCRDELRACRASCGE
jgi:hypothetical protein